MEDAIKDKCEYEFQGIKASPERFEYRNKMEFSFGDAEKGGPLTLGLHKKGSPLSGLEALRGVKGDLNNQVD